MTDQMKKFMEFVSANQNAFPKLSEMTLIKGAVSSMTHVSIDEDGYTNRIDAITK